jgi:hypothetical protein
MIRGVFVIAFFAAASGPALASEPPEFESSAEQFVDAGACVGRLEQIVADARGGDFDAAEGPYEVAAADMRAHTVRAESLGHRISEYRCAGAALASRSWVERMDHRADGAYSIESLASAQWLDQGSRE